MPLPELEDELQTDRVGYREGLRWMRSNPRKVAVLMFHKQMWYLGNDSDALYSTFNGEKEEMNAASLDIRSGICSGNC